MDEVSTISRSSEPPAPENPRRGPANSGDDNRFARLNAWAAKPTDKHKVVMFSNIESDDPDVVEQLSEYMPAPYPVDLDEDDPLAADQFMVKSLVFLDEQDEPYICQSARGDGWPREIAAIMSALKLRLSTDRITEPREEYGEIADSHYLTDDNVEYDYASNSIGEAPGWRIVKWQVKRVRDPRYGDLMCDFVTWQQQDDSAQQVLSRHGWKPY